MREQFTFHKLNVDGIDKAKNIAEGFDQLLGYLETVCCNGEPLESREFAIAVTKLEESCFFAKKAMAIRLKNQDI